MSKLEKYPAYKDSGVEWLGEIPEGWELIKLSHIFKASKGSNAAKLTKEYCETINGKYNVYSGQTENNGVMDSINIYEFDFNEKGCLFTTTVGAKAMTLNYLQEKFNLSQNCMIMFSNKDNIFTKFFYYHLQPLFSYERQLIPDHMQPSFRMEDFYQFNAALPPKQEQIKIATFLDEKTKQLDKAIQQKEQLIKLLKERRQILINDAVTKGLDKTVAMKDSGVEWIGEIPEGWEVKKLRYLGKTQNGISAGSEYFGKGFPFINYGDVYKNAELPKLVSGLANSSREDRNTYSVCKGDVFFTRTSETAVEIGFSSTCIETFTDAIFSGFLIRFRPNKKLYEGYSKYYFRSSIHRAYFVKEMNLVIRASLSQELLKNLPVILPSWDEQIDISNHIEENNQKIDKVINLQQQQITKLKEYKTTLIDSVVTGKVRVS